MKTTHDRLVVVDALRGFAIVGVLFANFTGYTDQQVPNDILMAHAGRIDVALMHFNAIFVENKFITLFCILFGYSFGLFMESVDRQAANPGIVFGRRMGFLFLIGFIHCSFWWFDVLHVYAICGLFLLLFRKLPLGKILVWSLSLFLVVPFVFSLLAHDRPDALTDADRMMIYENFKRGDLATLLTTNYSGYYAQFIKAWENFDFWPATLGKILLGFLLYRMEFFKEANLRVLDFHKWLWITGPIAIGYLLAKHLQRTDIISLDNIYLGPVIQLGVLGTTAFYSLLLVRFYLSRSDSMIVKSLTNLGRMTLSNYLAVSAVMILTLYGVGFGMLGDLSMRMIWLMGVGWLLIEIAFSTWWLKRFRYGPMEGLWRRVTWWRRGV